MTLALFMGLPRRHSKADVHAAWEQSGLPDLRKPR